MLLEFEFFQKLTDIRIYFLITGPQNLSDSHRNIDSKRLETEAPSQNTSPSHCTSTLDLNFPLPAERGPACLVKVKYFLAF